MFLRWIRLSSAIILYNHTANNKFYHRLYLLFLTLTVRVLTGKISNSSPYCAPGNPVAKKKSGEVGKRVRARGKGIIGEGAQNIRTFILIDCFYCRPDFSPQGRKDRLSTFHTNRHPVIVVIDIIFPVFAFILSWILCRSSLPLNVSTKPRKKNKLVPLAAALIVPCVPLPSKFLDRHDYFLRFLGRGIYFFS